MDAVLPSTNSYAEMQLPATDLAAPADAQTQAVARVAEYSPGNFLALPPLVTYALVEHPAPQLVPRAANYAYGLLAWQRGYIPLIDFDALLRGAPAPATAPRYALIVAYRDSAQQEDVQFGAIGLAGLPFNVAVTDDDQCPLPDSSPLWDDLALSCFLYQGTAVPILDTSWLFGASHSKQA